MPLGVMERLPSPGAEVTLATELVVREDGWALYGFLDETERRFFQRLTSVTGVGPKIGIALLSALGVERGARALREKNIALLSSVNGIGRKTAERLALELGEKVEEFTETPSAEPPAGSEAALKALERLGYATPEADRYVAHSRFSQPDDRTTARSHGRMDLHALRLDEPTARARRRHAGGGCLPPLPHAPCDRGGQPSRALARAGQSQTIG